LGSAPRQLRSKNLPQTSDLVDELLILLLQPVVLHHQLIDGLQ
jgi:hypothetical protein